MGTFQQPNTKPHFAMKRLLLFLLVPAFLVPLSDRAAGQQLPDATTIVERYLDAVGGRAAIDAIAYRRTETEMEAPGMTMRIVTLQARPNRSATIMNLPGLGEMRTGFDGEVAWSVDPMQGARILEGAERIETIRQAGFDANMDFAAQFPEMQTIQRTELSGRPCYEVRMTSAEGMVVRNCFDVESGLLIGGTAQQNTPMGPMEATLYFEDYRETDGILIPHTTRISTMGQSMVMHLRSVSHEPIDDETFVPPAEIRALME
jgi:hypothetical protein